MEFETWNNDTLITEVKAAMISAKFQPFKNVLGFSTEFKYYSDDELKKKNDHQLRSMYVQFKSHDKSFRQEYEEYQEKKRFFNQPDCNADYSYWSKQAYWSINEAIALILGKDPRKVTWDEVKKYIPNSPFANKFNELKELASRYVICKELYDPVFPGVFLAWIERMDISIPIELKEAVNTIGMQVADWKGNYENASAQYNQLDTLYKQAIELMNTKDEIIAALKLRIANPMEQQLLPDVDNLKETERQSLYKLVAAMAYNGYGYNAQESKSPIPRELSEIVTQHLGENIDTDTSRKWLKEASSRYPNKL